MPFIICIVTPVCFIFVRQSSDNKINSTLMKVSKQSKVNTLAAQLRRHDKSLDLSQAFRKAWEVIKSNDNAQLLVFTKADGTTARRVVEVDWLAYYQPKGGKSSRKPGQRLFADLARVITRPDYPIISTYEDRIITLAA